MHAIPRRRLAAVAIAVSLTAPVAVSVGGAAAGATTSSTTSSTTGSATSSTTGSATSTAPFCGITWGSLPKATSPDLHWTGAVTRTRYGEHTCYDRLVFDIAPGRGAVGYSVRYVNEVTGPGSGLPVPLTGGAKIQITINAPSTLARTTTNFYGWRTFRQLKGLGSFEGYTDYGLGVRARLPMRVLVLTDADGGRRLVVDVAHSW